MRLTIESGMIMYITLQLNYLTCRIESSLIQQYCHTSRLANQKLYVAPQFSTFCCIPLTTISPLVPVSVFGLRKVASQTHHFQNPKIPQQVHFTAGGAALSSANEKPGIRDSGDQQPGEQNAKTQEGKNVYRPAVLIYFLGLQLFPSG